MELEELLQKIQEESIQYTGISNVKIYNELGEELKGIKMCINTMVAERLKYTYIETNYRLPEWREFCAWIEENLPYFKELCLTKMV